MSRLRSACSRLLGGGFLAACLAAPVHADLEQAMEKKWGALVNGTPHQAYREAGRGVLAGGRFKVSTDVMTANPVAFQPPGIRAGCGGISLFGGSFSMFDTDRWIQLARDVASNAVAYSFQLAMQNMCPSCSQLMQKIQSGIQSMNKYLGNSCRAAKALVPSSTLKEYTKKWGQRLNNFARDKGWVADQFAAESKGSSTERSQAQEEVTQYQDPSRPGSEISKAINANIAYEAMKRQQAQKWWSAGGDKDLREAIMSLTGTLIVTADELANPDFRIKPSTLKVNDLINGGRVELYECPNDRCLPNGAGNKLTTETVTLPGFRERIENILLGGGKYRRGMVEVLMMNQGTLHPDQKAFLDNVPLPIGGALHNLGNKVGLGTSYAQATAHDLAIILVQQIVDEMAQTVSMSLQALNKPGVKKYQSKFNDRREAIYRNLRKLARPNKANARFLQAYQSLINSLAVQPPDLFISGG